MAKNRFRVFISFLLAAEMILSTLPTGILQVSAENTEGTSVQEEIIPDTNDDDEGNTDNPSEQTDTPTVDEKTEEESKTEVLQKIQPSKTEVSKTEISKPEGKIEISVSERSKVSVKEPKVYDYTIASDVYEISEDVIYIPQGTTVADFKKGMKYGDCKITFTNHNEKSVTSGQMGTGWRIDFSGDGTVSYYTVVQGDVTGEGNINSRDIYLMRDYLFGKEGFTKYQELAADIKKNGIIDSVDMYMIKKIGSE